VLARQVLYHLSQNSSPIFYMYFNFTNLSYGNQNLNGILTSSSLLTNSFIFTLPNCHNFNSKISMLSEHYKSSLIDRSNFVFLLTIFVFELQVSYLLDRHSTPWARPSTPPNWVLSRSLQWVVKNANGDLKEVWLQKEFNLRRRKESLSGAKTEEINWCFPFFVLLG
jgi:hypothetical protein